MKDNISDTESVFEAYHRLKVQPVIQQRKDKKNRKKREANDSAASSAELGRQSAETLQKLDNRAIAAWKIQAWWRQKLDNKAKAIAAWKIQAWWRKRRTHLLPTNPYHARYRSEYTYFINGQEPSKLLRSPDRAKQRQVIEMLNAKSDDPTTDEEITRALISLVELERDGSKTKQSYDPAICQGPDFPYVVNALMCLGAERGGITMEQGYTLLDIHQRQVDDPRAKNFVSFRMLDDKGNWSAAAESCLLTDMILPEITYIAKRIDTSEKDILELCKQSIAALPQSEQFFFVRVAHTVKIPTNNVAGLQCSGLELYMFCSGSLHTHRIQPTIELNLTFSALKAFKQTIYQPINPEHSKVFTVVPRLGIQDTRDIEFAGRHTMRPAALFFPEIKPFGSRGIHGCTQITYTTASAHDYAHTALMALASRPVVEAAQCWINVIRTAISKDIQTSQEKESNLEVMTKEIWVLVDWNVLLSNPETLKQKDVTREFCYTLRTLFYDNKPSLSISAFFHHQKINSVCVYLLLWDLLERPVVWDNYGMHAGDLTGELKVAMDETVRPVFNALSQTTQQQQKPRLNMLQCILHRRELEKRSDGVNSPFYINWAAALSSKESDYLYSHLTFSRNGGEAGQQRNTVSLSFDFLGHKINVMDPLAADLIGFLIKMQRLLADSGLQDQDVVDSFLKETIGKNVVVLCQQQNIINLQNDLSSFLKKIMDARKIVDYRFFSNSSHSRKEDTPESFTSSAGHTKMYKLS